jgi:hypothetical protein
MNKKCLSFALLAIIPSLLIQQANASAGWYPTHPGDVIQLDFCIPSNASSPIFLQLIGDNQKSLKQALKVDLTDLRSSSYCQILKKRTSSKNKLKLLELKYNWRVNVEGDFALQVFIPNLHKSLAGWPDGISSNVK